MLAVSERTAATGDVQLFSTEETAAAKQAMAENASNYVTSGNISGAIPRASRTRNWLTGEPPTGNGARTVDVEKTLAESDRRQREAESGLGGELDILGEGPRSAGVVHAGGHASRQMSASRGGRRPRCISSRPRRNDKIENTVLGVGSGPSTSIRC